MPQHLVPTSDISNQSWIPSTVWDQIDEDAGSSVTTNIYEPPGAIFKVHLKDGLDPETGKDHVFVFELKGEYHDEEFPEISFLDVNVKLMQGTGTITGTLIRDPPEEFTRYEIPLTETEANSISDYSDLRVHVDAGYAAEDDMGVGG